MKLCVLLCSTFCSPPLSWSSLNSLQLISNIPVRHAGGSSTLHRDNALPAPAQDCHVCVQVLHLLSGHCALAGVLFAVNHRAAVRALAPRPPHTLPTLPAALRVRDCFKSVTQLVVSPSTHATPSSPLTRLFSPRFYAAHKHNPN